MRNKPKLNILTAKNGVALVAVMAILLILTLLLPVMFTMSESATEEAVKGTDKQRASYLARTTIEMAVAAFEKEYETNKNTFNTLINDTKTEPITVSTVYMYQDDDMSAEDYAKNYNSYYRYTLEKPEAGTRTIGYCDGTITYENTSKYFEITSTGKYIDVTDDGGEKKFKDFKELVIDTTAAGNSLPDDIPQYVCEESKKIIFSTHAVVNGKAATRKCVLVLPTDSAQKEWILPASTDGTQVFANSDKVTSVLSMSLYDESNKSSGNKDGKYSQPIYVYSAIGNLSINFDNLKTVSESKDADGNTIYTPTGNKYEGDKSQLSFGVYPAVRTIPENDSSFSCLKGVNMSAWSTSAQKENFVAFTATNLIEVDVPVYLLVYPTRTRAAENLAFKDGWLGLPVLGSNDNHSLYKMLAFQSPDIVFNDKVVSMLSLYYDTSGSGNRAKRMTSLLFAAPDNTPYSYWNESRNCYVNAGRVFFMQDCYIWLIKYGEKGSGYKDPSGNIKIFGANLNFNTEETVYYVGSDISVIKIANAGDVYYYNNDVVAEESNTLLDIGLNKENYLKRAGFSLSGYFFDVLYTKEVGNKTFSWWEVIKSVKSELFKQSIESKNETYMLDDFHFLGNIYDGTFRDEVPEAEDYVVYWES